jgi:hypothetical protein
VLGTYCGGGPKPSLDTFGNIAKVIFHSDEIDQEKSGFLIKINASIEGTDLNIASSLINICIYLIRMRRRN